MASTSGWTADGTPGNVGNDQGTNNSSEFNAKPGGLRVNSGAFAAIGSNGYWWSSTEDSTSDAWYRYIFYNASYVFSSPIFKVDGFYIRLIKDSTSLIHGQTGTYIGNDGKTYTTICIGTQEWMSENLKETKYRDNSSIPEITDNTTWSNDTTGARCSYNNS